MNDKHHHICLCYFNLGSPLLVIVHLNKFTKKRNIVYRNAPSLSKSLPISIGLILALISVIFYVVRELDVPGEIYERKTYAFEFSSVEMPYETYNGVNVRLRYTLSNVLKILKEPFRVSFLLAVML